MCYIAGGRAMVEIKLLYIPTCIIWNLGRCFHVLLDKYIWCHCIFEIWLDSRTSWSDMWRSYSFSYRSVIISTTHNVFKCLYVTFLTVFVALISVLSAVGICERCRVERGGVYFLIAHILGSRFGGSLGLLYCFGQVILMHCYNMCLYL